MRLWCGVEAQQDLAKSAPFRNLADGEFIKIMCVRNGCLALVVACERSEAIQGT